MTAQPVPAGAAPPISDEAAVMHIWVAAGHTLCELERGDRRAEMSEIENEDAVACGPCLLIVGRLRRQACALLNLSGDQVAPARPTQAWRLLGDASWGRRVDVASFLERPGLDDTIRYEAIRYAVDPASVEDLVDELHDVRARLKRNREAQERRRARRRRGELNRDDPNGRIST